MNEFIQGLGLDFRAFCHLEPGHCFSDGHLRSVLCARCCGIYGGFLVAWLLALALRWNGRWGRSGIAGQVVAALGLIGLSALHVLLELASEAPVIASNETHFAVGCLSALGLLQLSLLMREERTVPCRLPSWGAAALFLAVLAVQLLACRRFLDYCASSTLAGLVLLYWVMNSQVLQAFLPELPAWKRAGAVILAVAAEWAFLLWYKTGWPGRG